MIIIDNRYKDMTSEQARKQIAADDILNNIICKRCNQTSLCSMHISRRACFMCGAPVNVEQVLRSNSQGGEINASDT